jgi:hypothetical protein
LDGGDNAAKTHSFPPPARHYAINLAEKPPHEIAELALGYYRSVLEQAQSKFIEPPT